MVRDHVGQERQTQAHASDVAPRWAQHSTRGGRRSRRRELVLACQCQRKELRLFVSPQESLREFERTKAFSIFVSAPGRLHLSYLAWLAWCPVSHLDSRSLRQRFTSASLPLLLGPGHPQVPARDAQVPFARTRPKRRGGDRWWEHRVAC